MAVQHSDLGFHQPGLAGCRGANIRFVQGDVAPIHTGMVRVVGGRNVWLAGGGDLVGQFHDHGLLDEIILSVAPVMLSSCASQLPRNITTPSLKLTDAQKHGDVFAVLTYEVQKRFGNDI